MTDLASGANLALPDDGVDVTLSGPFDLSALVVGPSGTVSGDADMVFYNAPTAPGVTLRGQRLAVRPRRLRRGAARVVVLASPEDGRTPFGRLPAPATRLLDGHGATLARLAPPRLATETVVVLAEVYRRGEAWRVRAIGQGYADGLAGLARDYGVDVADPEPPAPDDRPDRRDPAARSGRGRGPDRAAPGPADRGSAGRADPGRAAPGPADRGSAGRADPGRAAPGPADRGSAGRPDNGRAGAARTGQGRADPVQAARHAAVVAATNAERAAHGLAPLTVDARLAAAAQAHTEDMVARAFFAHESPDGRQVWDRALAAGYAYRKVAENIAAGQRDAAEVVDGWMHSPGHRRNILHPELTQIGVGTATGGSYGLHWTQVFGTPR